MLHFYARFSSRQNAAVPVSIWQTLRKHLNSKPLTTRLASLLISFCLLTPLLSTASNADQHPDYAALTDFYNSTNGSGWINSAGWLKDNNPCGWYGVGCTDGRVTELSMMYNNVTGSLPKSVGNLIHLKKIELRNNGISGTIPEEIGKLTKLEGLFLIHNQLSGSIPNSIGNLVNLKMLLLRENQLTGPIPSSVLNMQKLESLNLAINQLSGEIPGNIGDLSSLTSLHLEQNKFTGSIPESLGKLTGMSNVTLDNNELSGNIPSSLGNLTNLFQLTLNNNKLTGSIPSSLGDLEGLYTLHLNNNQLTGPIPDTFGEFPKILSLSLHNNELTGSIPGSLSKLTTLSEIRLNNNKLTGSIPSELGDMTHLNALLLYNNQLTGPIPASLGKLTNIIRLSLNNNQLEGTIPSYLGDLSNLMTLELYGNKLTGTIPLTLANLKNLNSLILGGNQLTGTIPDNLGELTSLFNLNLSYNNLTGSIPNSIGKLVNLLGLGLSNNKLTGSIPNGIGNLVNLQALVLNENELSGSIPSEIGNLVKLDRIYLDNNKLSGTIPASLGNLPNLRQIYLNFNELAGPIPDALGNLSKLESLQLFYNKLSGKIPSSLGKLSLLEYLHLHGNQLNGPIPSDLGQLSNLKAIWLSDNNLSGCFPESLRALCGKNVQFYNNPGLPGGGNFDAFCRNEPGSNSVPSPSLTLKSGVTQPIAQNTASVSLTVSGCEGGTINWSATNNTSGSGSTIPVATTTPGNVVYSATCTSGGCTSAPANFAVTVAASPAAGNYDGHLDGADCETFHGWVWDRDKVNTPIAVEILDGSTVIATVLADAFRQDLLSAGKGNGQHAFYFSIPASLKDGKTHSLSARVAGGTFLLKGGAKTIVCQGGTTPPTNQPPVAPTINALTAQQGTAFSTVLPVFTDPEGGPLTYSLSGLPNGLSFNMATRQISGMPTQSGNFGLMYAATDNQNATTSLSILLTVNATTGTPVTGNFDGHLDGATCETFHGWVWDRDKVNTPILVEILDGSTVIATVLADAFRQDLLSAGKGNAQHAFYFSIPASLKDGKTHSLSARVAGGTFLLKGGAKTIMCQGGTTPPINQPPVAPTVNALTAQQGTAFSTVLPVFTDPEGGPLTYSLSGLPNGLSFNTATRQLSGTPMQSGSFGLTYAATDNQNQTTRLSVSLTVNAPATTPVTGDFDGYLDKVECGTIRGWAWDRNKPNAPVHIEFYTGNTVWGSAVANIYRDDLKNAAKGNGAHAYSFDVPTVLKDNQTRLISARIAGSGYVLKWSGKALTCSPTAGRLSAERGTELAVTVLGNPVLKDALEVEVRGAAGQSMHLQLTDAQGRVISERRVEQPHVIERQTLPLGHQPAGLLLLKTTSGSRSVILKVVKQ